MTHVGQCIEFWRETRNYSQQYVAHHLNISQVAYSNREKGKTKVDANELVKLAALFNISVHELCPLLSNIFNQISTNTTPAPPASDISLLYERIIKAKDETISQLQTVISASAANHSKTITKNLTAKQTTPP
jgi:transcriptional regulator with XRE-family HTH domain